VPVPALTVTVPVRLPEYSGVTVTEIFSPCSPP
jgi:hypothetical protein